MKVSELTGPLLDYWVAKSEGKKVRVIPAGSYPYDDKETEIFFRQASGGYIYGGEIGLSDEPPDYSPSTDWSQGGPIIQRERIMLEPIETWVAHLYGSYEGGTPLIAAMRCFVSSVYGEEVPDE